ncbi:MAG: hypothetical protein EU541_06770, partial [Promethearchaeota archaeon]
MNSDSSEIFFYCNKCKEEINPRECNFCPNCGQNLSNKGAYSEIGPTTLIKNKKHQKSIDILHLIGGLISFLILFLPIVYVKLELISYSDPNVVFTDSGIISIFEPNTFQISEYDTPEVRPIFFIIGALICILGGIFGIFGGLTKNKTLKIMAAIICFGAFIIIIAFSLIIIPNRVSIYSRRNFDN